MLKLKNIAIGLMAFAIAFSLGASSVWLYQQASEFDAQGNQPNVKGKIMKRKSTALQAALDAVLAGDLDDAARHARSLGEYSEAIDAFLATDMYRNAGRAFTLSVSQLQNAASNQDWIEAREAALAIESACLDCHQQLLVQRN